jgi:hypothetical protein
VGGRFAAGGAAAGGAAAGGGVDLVGGPWAALAWRRRRRRG